MKSANEVLQDEFLALTANMQRLSESEVLIVVGILKQLEREISGELLDNPKLSQYTKRKYNALINQNKSTINAAYKRINEQNQALLYEVGALSQVGTQRAFSTIGFSLDSVALNSDQLKALASNTWIEGAPSSEWWKKQNSNLQYAFMTQMRMGYAAGESIDQLVERVRGTSDGKKVPYIIDGETKYYTEFSGGILNTSRRQAETLVRTSVMSISAVASENMFESVADILKGIMWVATLDFRTTLLCSSRDRKLYTLNHEPIGHNLPWLNGPGRAHWRCRSRAVPVTKSWEELGALPGIDKIWNKNMPQKLRSSLNGYVPQDLSFEDWLKGLPETDQIAYLGKKKYQIWKERGLTLEQLIDQRGNPLTLKQLANVYGYKVKTPLTLGMPSVPKSYPTALQTQQTAETLARDIVDSMEVAAKEEATKQVSKLTKNNPIASKLVQQAIVAGAVSNDDPVNMAAYLASALAAEEESRKRLAEERRRLNEGLHELKGTMSDQFIDYKERAAALKFVEDSDSILPSEKSAIYANKLAEIKQINSDLSNRLASLIEDDAALMSLFKKFSETASYREWDMRYTVDKFKKFVASSDAGRNSTRILRKIAKL